MFVDSAGWAVYFRYGESTENVSSLIDSKLILFECAYIFIAHKRILIYRPCTRIRR